MDFRGHYESEADVLARLSSPVKSSVLPRWQRKQLQQQQQQQQQQQENSIPAPISTSDIATPRKQQQQPLSASATTPQADRFIANRAAMDMDAAHFNLTASAAASSLLSSSSSSSSSSGSDSDDSDDVNSASTPSKRAYRADLSNQLFADAANAKILAFKQKAPEPKDGYQNQLKVLYSQNRAAAGSSAAQQRKAAGRVVPAAPIKILDAPDMSDDFYLNLLDWSEENVLAVGLGQSVYLWNATTGGVSSLTTLADNTAVTSISWSKDGDILSVGTSNNEIQVWDVAREKRLRTMRGHAGRVVSLAWNNNILSSGARDGMIHHNDVRIADHVIARLQGHTHEVCGLKWSSDGTQLASGGNDNLLNIWGGVSSNLDQRPLFSLTHHRAAVKALAWCPWQNNLLASGGGVADRQLRFWNTANGTCINAIDTESQVCSIVWSKQYKELVTSHGLTKNQLTLWRYPTLTKVAELTGHTSRVLHMAISPDGERVASAGGDETLRLWHCFQPTPVTACDKESATSRAAFKTAGRARDLTSSGLAIR